MCGFVGVFRESTAQPVLAADLRARLREIAHRGPDGDGVYAEHGVGLAAARLAIQGDERGDQPLTSRDGRFVLVFNGEILGPEAAALRRLVTDAGLEAPTPAAGDGPLLAEAVAALARGTEALDGNRLRELLAGSMGAFACLDRQTDVLWLVRDRLGVKPLFVVRADGDVHFASELKPLLALSPDRRRPDPDGLAELLHWHRPCRHLPFVGAEAVPPGAVWRVGRGGRLTKWEGRHGIRDLVDRRALDPDAAVAALAEAWRDASRSAATADVGVVVLLSGGLDSGAVALFGSRDTPALRALTGRFAPLGGPLDESDQAACVAQAAGLAHEVLDLADADLITDLPAVVRALEMPMAGPGALALWRVAARARELGARVLLTGTGGDELLGGYTRTALVAGRRGPWTDGYEALAARLDAAGAGVAARQREVIDRSGDLLPLLDPDFRATLPAVTVPSPVASGWVPPDDDVVSALIDEEVETTLPMLLQVEDRIGMAHGLEGRPVPCLGRVPAAAARVPTAELIGPDGEGKRALRQALEGVMPDAVRLDRRKRGFPTPFARAARAPESRPAVEALLADRRFRERGWWDVPACRALLDTSRPVHDRALYALLSWEMWARAFLDGDAFESECNG